MTKWTLKVAKKCTFYRYWRILLISVTPQTVQNVITQETTEKKPQVKFVGKIHYLKLSFALETTNQDSKQWILLLFLHLVPVTAQFWASGLKRWLWSWSLLFYTNFLPSGYCRLISGAKQPKLEADHLPSVSSKFYEQMERYFVAPAVLPRGDNVAPAFAGTAPS
jgi:hypothetical protein